MDLREGFEMWVTTGSLHLVMNAMTMPRGRYGDMWQPVAAAAPHTSPNTSCDVHRLLTGLPPEMQRRPCVASAVNARRQTALPAVACRVVSLPGGPSNFNYAAARVPHECR